MQTQNKQKYYPLTDYQPNMKTFMASYFVGECETEGPIMQKHPIRLP